MTTPILPGGAVDPLQKVIDSLTGSTALGAAGKTVSGAVDQAVKAVKAVPGLVPGADAANSALDGLVAVRRWVSDRHNWLRVGWFVAGMALMYGGALMIVKPEIQSAASAVTKVVPAGKIGKAVAS